MTSLEDYYPIDCPFCKISDAYPASSASPVPYAPDPDKIAPQAHLILSTPHILAFLDILPISPGHVLVTTREHYRKLSDLYTTPKPTETWVSNQKLSHARDTARALGEWLPILSSALCKATGIEDWNVVQNNGERAAQVVPHVHFHIIPRYQEGRRETEKKGHVDVGMLKSWRMFGRGAREELDDDEGVEIARELREALRSVLGEESKEDGKGEKSKL
jgi:diadenosine tetraphosphate (Ap4A) HIT family hydrolase